MPFCFLLSRCGLLLLLICFFAIYNEVQAKKVLHLGSSASHVPNVPQLNCAAHIAEYEKKHQIPSGLLHAISKVESGRKDKTGQIVSWPWTVNSGGKSNYFPTKEAAMAAVKKMQRDGVKNIDVGCMQVNLQYHPKAFKTLDDAFDPQTNVAYASRFLKSLKTTHESWHKAIAYYHSANAEFHVPYRNRVLNAWDQGKDIALILADLRPNASDSIHSGAASKRAKVINARNIRASDKNQIIKASDPRPSFSLHRRTLKL